VDRAFKVNMKFNLWHKLYEFFKCHGVLLFLIITMLITIAGRGLK
jgi:hypothetical protein